MRIASIANGRSGDVQPYVAIGKQLIAHGHQVLLITTGATSRLCRLCQHG